MPLPRKVKIGWRTYNVIEGERRSVEGGADLWGEIEYLSNVIWLYAGLSDENKMVTLLHEILHGIFYQCGREANRHDEGLINAISENIFQLFKDNPELLIAMLPSQKADEANE